jgi:hypothetical protein
MENSIHRIVNRCRVRSTLIPVVLHGNIGGAKNMSQIIKIHAFGPPGQEKLEAFNKTSGEPGSRLEFVFAQASVQAEAYDKLCVVWLMSHRLVCFWGYGLVCKDNSDIIHSSAWPALAWRFLASAGCITVPVMGANRQTGFNA